MSFLLFFQTESPEASGCSTRHSRAAEQRDERAAVHSITSSARASSVIGKLRPSALAVLRLIANSTFTACWTGSSAG